MTISISPEVAICILLLVGMLVVLFHYWKSGRTTVGRGPDAQAAFLKELVDGYNYWKARGHEEYAEAYKVLINKFSTLEEPDQ